MDLKGFDKAVQRYLNGQATDEDLILIEQWFRQTEGNDYQLTEERKRIIAGRLLPRLHAITRSQADTPVRPRGLFRRLPLRFARIAAVLAVIAMAGGAGWVFRYQLLDRIAPVARQTIKAGPYEIKKVQLPDQTMVTLNAGASVSFPVTYRGNERTATIEGEAFFEVAKDKGRSFVVHASSLNITVLGTSFVVTDKSAFATVSVVTGKVKVTADEKQLAELKPGLQVFYNKRSGMANLRQVNIPQVTAWTQHSFSFTGAPLEEVLKQIGKKWNVHLILPDRPSGKQFSGDFSNNDSLDDMMAALALATGIHWDKTAAGTIRITYP